MKDTMIRLANISKYYMIGQNVAMGLNGITLSFSLGEFAAITGESGSGKSTLAHVIAGILPYEDGELYINEKPTSHYDGVDWERYRRDQVSYISQEYGILPGNTVLENVISALRLSGMEEAGAEKKAEEILRQVELWEMRKRRAAKLSSGQKQRLSIARALAKPAPILIADEPTGNLDPDNSKKVIELLAQAAKGRLVILITHDFDEAADYVSRHIVLQDGKVAQDSWLKSNTEVENVPLITAKEKGLGWYAAKLQLVSRPVWTTIMVLFFAMTAFGIFAVLGTFYASLDDVSTRYYSNSAFRNGNDRRVVVQRMDGYPMREGDYKTLVDVQYVAALERFDLMQDINYYYREDIDLEYKYRQQGGSGENVQYKITPVFKNYGLFMQTVPILPEGQRFLTAGCLPEHANEVVAVGDESLIGTKLTVYIQNRKTWSEDAYLVKEVMVVGVTEYGEGLYFSERMGRMINQAFYGKETIGMIWGVGDELKDNEITYSQRMVELYGGYKGFWDNRIISNPNDTVEQIEFTAVGENPSRYYEYMEMSEAMFDNMVMAGDGYQVSIFLEDYSYTDRVIDVVMDLGYEAVSPYRLGSVQQIDRLAQARMNTLGVCLLAMAAVLVLQVVVVRAMFGLEIPGFRILSDIGLTCCSARLSILWQTLVLTVMGQVIGLLILAAGAAFDIEYVVNVTKYLGIPQVLLLCALHLVISMLTVIWTGGALRKRVYPFAKREDDLEWEETVL
ncbi:MAG: ABC transporter ATP-binding protein [Firmicutes bacterium]|nr:ABC transporter ATP-binding protein [Bacillota bacterium]